MKNFKKIIKIFIVLVFTICQFSFILNVKAIDKDLINENNNIVMPFFIYSDGSKITITGSTDYTLYGYWEAISTEKYNEINNIQEECKGISEEENTYSDNNKPSRDSFSNDGDYNNAVTEYNNKIKEYNSKITACNEKYYNAVPNIDDSKWEELENDTVYLPNNNFSGTRPYILYLKLDDRTNDIIDYEFGILKVDGQEETKKTYTAYKTGDKVSIKLNDSTTADFYVITDSSSTESSVTAIYDGILGDYFWFAPSTDSIEGSKALEKLQELTNTWSYPQEIRLIRAEEINPSLDIANMKDSDIANDSFYSIGESYWTETVASNGEKLYPYVVTNWNTFSNLHSTLEDAPTNSGAIRPVITISKEYVNTSSNNNQNNNNNNEAIKNPQTSITNIIYILVPITIFIGVIIFIKSYNKTKYENK